ncbi:MAG: decaprenyl-phosphate phosphoribosyltransferase [Candidatus Aminicenantes bacterium]|nr:decaprenyl-phosphate phosphoribosyltransferase [Candidatus Aminicenantes bacterium]
MGQKIKAIVRSLRPYQWSKNFFVFAPLIFAQKLLDWTATAQVVAAFCIFCLLSGGLYIFNDLQDYEEDKKHPKKCQRPIAAGLISQPTAYLIFISFSLFSLGTALLLRFEFFLLVLSYFIIQVLYSLKLKHVVILDVFIISGGFFLRVIAGGIVIAVPLSSWLLICTILLALFLAMSKRRHELVLLEAGASAHRPILEEYSPYFLDQMISVVTASTLMAYCLYTISEETITKFGTRNLVFTTPFVLYGIFRYLYLIHQKKEGGSPEELILKDKPLLINIILWLATIAVILYIK